MPQRDLRTKKHGAAPQRIRFALERAKDARLRWVGRQRRRILLCVALGSATAHAQSSPRYALIDGLVTDQLLAPLADATIAILGSNIKVVTGLNGRFQVVRLPAGHYVLMIRRLGFSPVSALVDVAEGDTARMSFALERVVALDTMVVSAARPAGLLGDSIVVADPDSAIL